MFFALPMQNWTLTGKLFIGLKEMAAIKVIVGLLMLLSLNQKFYIDNERGISCRLSLTRLK